MITKVKLINWKSHLNSEFEFTKGTNGLVGKIGSGKTSLLDGICFALFGTFPTLQSKKIKLDDVILAKPFHQDKAEVFVEFFSNGKKYCVKRVIERGKGTVFSEIKEDGKTIEAPSSIRVTEIVEKILKINYELFTKAIYSEQNYLDYFLRIPKGQRMKKIDELLMIDKFEEVRANCVSTINKIAERKIGIETLLSQLNISELKKEFENMEKSMRELAEREKELKENLTKVSKERIITEKEFEEVKNIKQEFNELEKKVESLNKAIEELKESTKSFAEIKIEDLPLFEKKFRDLEEKIKKLEEEQTSEKEKYEKFYSMLLKFKSDFEILKKEKIEIKENELNEKLKKQREIEEIEKIFGKDVDKKLEEKRELREELLAKIEFLKMQINETQKQIESISSAIGKCPVCDRELSEEMKESLIKQRKMSIIEFEKKLEEICESEKLTEKEIKEIEECLILLNKMLEEIKDLEKLKGEIEEAKKEIFELNEKITFYDKEVIFLKENLKRIENEIFDSLKQKSEIEAKILRIEEFKAILKRLEELRLQREIFGKKLKELGEILVKRKIEEIEKNLMNLLVKEKEIQSMLKSLAELVEERNLRKMEIEKKLSILEKEKKTVERFDRLIKQLKIFEKALEQTQIELRKDFVLAVNYAMSKIWQDLYPYKDFVGAKLEIEEGDYVLKLQERSGRWVNVEGIASGGERALANLALRIAFALVLAPQLRWLILDEPTANLDSKAIQTFAFILKNNIPDFIDQTFVITHQEELVDGITGHLYKFERDKSKDEPTKVIKLI